MNDFKDIKIALVLRCYLSIQIISLIITRFQIIILKLYNNFQNCCNSFEVKLVNMSFMKITEQPSHYRHLEKMSVSEIIAGINNEDKKVAKQLKKRYRKLKAL